jgi:hypothetical protein
VQPRIEVIHGNETISKHPKHVVVVVVVGIGIHGKVPAVLPLSSFLRRRRQLVSTTKSITMVIQGSTRHQTDPINRDLCLSCSYLFKLLTKKENVFLSTGEQSLLLASSLAIQSSTTTGNVFGQRSWWEEGVMKSTVLSRPIAIQFVSSNGTGSRYPAAAKKDGQTDVKFVVVPSAIRQ